MASREEDGGQVSQVASIPDANDLLTSGRDASKRFQSVRYATEQDWAMHKTEIQRLYMDEELPLKEVMQTMKEKHNLNATYNPPPKPSNVI